MAHHDPGRTERMAAMYRQGLTLQKISEQFGVSRERVRQLIAAAGVTRVDGGQALQASMKKARKAVRREAYYMQKYGLPIEQVRALQSEGVTHAYTRQKQSARTRGIPFVLTFAEWFSVWQASGKLHLRGRGKGRYCMSRINDSGGYELGNVHIQLTEENGREAVKKWAGKHKSHRGVFLLYPGRERAWLARVGKESLGFFASCEEAVAARAAYLAEHPDADRTLGRGKGWTFLKRNKGRPYQMQCCGLVSYHATQEEAEQAYREAVERIRREREAANA